MYDIIFVILNYNTIDVTVNCVQSIKQNLDTSNYHIIIVDNCSKDDIGTILLDKYTADQRVSVHIMDCNMGFANGNNYGITLAREMQSKFICCMNNDTLLEQKDFYCQLESAYCDGIPAVIGPEIILKDGKIFRYPKHLKTVAEYRNKLDGQEPITLTVKRILLKVPIVYVINKKIKDKVYEVQIDDVVLHGCCIIFTPKFFEKLNGFDDRSFLYGEEELLYISLKKNFLVSRFSPNLKIRHLEDVSTDATIINKKEKKSFMMRHSNDSLQIIIKELEENPQLYD